MKTLLKHFLGLIAGIGVAILFCIGSIIVLGGICVVLMSVYHEHVRASCYDSDSSADIVKVAFVDRIFYLPKNQIKYCYPEQHDSDLATIEMVGKLPDFSKPEYELINYSTNEVRLHFYGTDINHKYNADSSVGIDDGLAARFKYEMTIMLKSGDEQKPKYEKARKTNFGLIWYKTRATGPGAQDMYVHKDTEGKVDLILHCSLMNKAPTSRRPSCSTIQRRHYYNVSSAYSYDRSHLPQALEIEKMMGSFIRNAQNIQ